MSKPRPSKPTERELEILQVLWKRGPSTAKEVHHTLSKARKTAYDSVSTMLSIMLEKGYVERDESSEQRVYQATYSKAEVEEALVKTFMDSVFGGSAMRLVTRALAVEATSHEDRRKIRQLLREMEDDRDDTD